MIIRSMQLSLFQLSQCHRKCKCILYSISHRLGIVKLKNIICTSHSLESCPVTIEIPGKQTTVAHRGGTSGKKNGQPSAKHGTRGAYAGGNKFEDRDADRWILVERVGEVKDREIRVKVDLSAVIRAINYPTGLCMFLEGPAQDAIGERG